MRSLLKNNLRFIAGILSAIMIVMFIAPFSCMNSSIVRADGSTDKRNELFVSLRWAMIRNKAAIDAGETIIFNIEEYGITYKDVLDCIADFQYFYTDFYFAKATYTVGALSEGESKDDTPITGIKLTSVFSLEEQNRLDAKINEIISLIPAGASDFDKVLFIHDYICTHSIYDPDLANDIRNNTSTVDHPNSFTAYGCLVEGMATCAGYSKAYKMIMDRLGIPCVIARSDKMHHVWNLIELDGEWYHVDTTWDDPSNNTPGFVSHKNFLKSDTGIVKATYKDHTGWVAPVKSSSTLYDNDAWFSRIYSQIHLVNGDYIYSGQDGLHTVLGEPSYSYSQYKIVSRTHDGKESDLFTYILNNSYLDTTSFTALINGYLYYNTSNQIIRYSLANKTSTVMFEDNNISIVGFYPDEDAKTAKIMYEISKYESAIKTVNLSAKTNSTGTSSNTTFYSQGVEIEPKYYTLSSLNELYCFPEVEFADGSTALYFADEKPVVTPTPEPTKAPTAAPTKAPTATPTAVPTKAPNSTAATPTAKPTNKPSVTTKPVPTESGVAGFTERLYTTCLGRDSEADGKAYWINELGKGSTGADVAKQFFFSTEFKDLKIDNKEYVTRLYRTIMDREPDQDGMNYWLGEMSKGQDREFVFEGFINSEEWADICLTYGIRSGGLAKPTFEKQATPEIIAFAERLYTTCLGRDAEQEGLTYWSQELANLRRTGTEAVAGFFNSDEFVGLKLDDKEYVTRLYKTFMGREPEEAGFNFWMGELKAGKGRQYVFDGFSTAQEFTEICAKAGIIR